MKNNNEARQRSIDDIKKFKKEREEAIRFQRDVLMAFEKSLNNDKSQDENQKQEQLASIKKKVLLQRQTRVINDLFNVFFSAECQKLYKPLLKLKILPQTGQIDRVDKIKDEERISIALGQVVQLCIYFALALGITFKNPMVFNGNRSYIHSENTIQNRLAPHKLFIPSKGEHNQMAKGIDLLEENLLKISRGLKFMKDRENIGFISSNADEDEPLYPNRIIRLLHKICNF